MKYKLGDILSIISALGVVLTIIVTYINNTKNNKLNIITAQRVKKYNDFQVASSNLFSSFELYNKYKTEPEYKTLIKNVYEFRTYLHYGFETDKMIIDLVDELINNIQNNINLYEFHEELNKLINMVDIYQSAEWGRIKTETIRDKRTKQYSKWLDEYNNCHSYNTKNQNIKRFCYEDDYEVYKNKYYNKDT